jgi:hypothetical protein
MTRVIARDIHKVVEGVGGKVVGIRHSKHYHVTYLFKGVMCSATFPRSPSDRAWMLIKANDLRADLRRRGLWT